MTKYLVDFERRVIQAELGPEGGVPSDRAERFVRDMLATWAKNAPLHVIVAMARAVIAVRRGEDKAEAEAN